MNTNILNIMYYNFINKIIIIKEKLYYKKIYNILLFKKIY